MRNSLALFLLQHIGRIEKSLVFLEMYSIINVSIIIKEYHYEMFIKS